MLVSFNRFVNSEFYGVGMGAMDTATAADPVTAERKAEKVGGATMFSVRVRRRPLLAPSCHDRRDSCRQRGDHMSHHVRLRSGVVMVLALTMLIANGTIAQEPTSASDEGDKPFKEEEIAALLAPIALYPDQLLAQVLMASTYPFEVVQAYRWVQQNGSLEGEALANAAGEQPWAESVQAMTAFPDILEMMDEKLDWTQQLGDAFLAQQEEVMAMVQTLRAKAKEAGNLKSDEYMTVVEEPAPAAAATPATTTTTVVPSTTTIVIQQADPEVIYVPSYSPTVVYGSWWYPAYPPYYFPPPVGYYHPVGAAFAWGVAVGVRVSFWHGAWNNHCNWHGGSINVNRNININGDVNIGSGNNNNINSGNRGQGQGTSATNRSGQSASATNQGGQAWSHDPEHRKGASYRDPATAQKYNAGGSAQASARNASRGQSGAGASASTRPAGGGATPTISGGSKGVSTSGGGSAALSGGNLGGSSSRGTGASSTQAAARPSSASKPQSYGGSSSRPTSSSANRGGAYSGMSSGSRASSYGSRGGASRGGRGGRR